MFIHISLGWFMGWTSTYTILLITCQYTD